ncbi:MAG: hypothetical protein B6I38_00800 [Anaerolineaceae bacterium 4572_5.1]|nr:MAG: hypothetical protein B6I38_00800 [Anaerolineaceae bacterium 4572_5.1]
MELSGETMTKKIVFIAGHMRGGSTLLSMLLGQQKGFFAAGELNRIWDGGFTNNELCTCGKPFKSCDFWNAVVENAFGGWDGVDAQEMQDLSKIVYPATKFPLLTVPSLRSTEYQEKVNRILDIWEKLYLAIFKISNSTVIVDSTKVSMYGILLTQIPNIDLYALHLNRHSCGVAYSKRKKRELPEVHWREEYMTTHSIVHSAYKWMMRNLSASSLKFSTPRYLHLRYETLAQRPKATISQLAEFIGETPPDLSFFNGNDKIVIKESHMFGGNPMRFQYHEKQIRLDDEWRIAMPLHQKASTFFLTWPLLLAYGYRGFP